MFMDSHEKLVSSLGKAYSPRTTSTRHVEDESTYLLQLSYQELFRESGKAEPRLSRLLGHISLHENVARWQQEIETGLPPFAKGREDVFTKTSPAPSNAFHIGQKANKVRSKATLSTLADFQAFIREQIENKEFVLLTTEDVCSDCDSEAE